MSETITSEMRLVLLAALAWLHEHDTGNHAEGMDVQINPTDLAAAIDVLSGVKDDAPKVWQVWVESDMTEGRGPMKPLDGRVYPTEQAAWDTINDWGGVSGRRVGVNCYPMDKLAEAGATTWQDYKRVIGSAGDYDVRPLTVVDE